MDKNPKDAFAQTPLHDAARMGHLEVCQLLMKDAYEKNPGDR